MSTDIENLAAARQAMKDWNAYRRDRIGSEGSARALSQLRSYVDELSACLAGTSEPRVLTRIKREKEQMTQTFTDAAKKAIEGYEMREAASVRTTNHDLPPLVQAIRERMYASRDGA